MEAKVLTAQSLCKRYGTLDALDHVDLTLEPGHIYRADRPQRRGQDDTALSPDGADAGGCGHRDLRRRACVGE